MSRFWRFLLGMCVLMLPLAVVIPMFQSGNWDSTNRRRTACMSNMKQLGLGLVQYSQDYDELLPPAASSDSSGWREAVYPYVKNTYVYRCPEDERDRNKDTPENLPKSYAANIVSLGKLDFSAPANVISLVDTRGFDSEDWNMTAPMFLPSTGCKLYAHFPSHAFYEHPPGTLNLLFADGHVKAMKPLDTLTPANLWTRNNAPFAGKDIANAQAILTHAENE